MKDYNLVFIKDGKPVLTGIYIVDTTCNIKSMHSYEIDAKLDINEYDSINEPRIFDYMYSIKDGKIYAEAKNCTVILTTIFPSQGYTRVTLECFFIHDDKERKLGYNDPFLNNSNNTITNTQKECTCDSQDLFNFGCKCGAFKK